MKRSILMLRNFSIILAFTFTLIVLFGLVTGAVLTNQSILSLLFLSTLIAIGGLVFFNDYLVYKFGDIALQVIYLIFINLSILIANYLFQWNLSWINYFLGIVASVILYTGVKFIIYSINKEEATKINEALIERRKNRVK